MSLAEAVAARRHRCVAEIACSIAATLRCLSGATIQCIEFRKFHSVSAGVKLSRVEPYWAVAELPWMKRPVQAGALPRHELLAFAEPNAAR